MSSFKCGFLASEISLLDMKKTKNKRVIWNHWGNLIVWTLTRSSMAGSHEGFV